MVISASLAVAPAVRAPVVATLAGLDHAATCARWHPQLCRALLKTRNLLSVWNRQKIAKNQQKNRKSITDRKILIEWSDKKIQFSCRVYVFPVGLQIFLSVRRRQSRIFSLFGDDNRKSMCTDREFYFLSVLDR